MISRVYFPQGAKELVVDSGGRITIEGGGQINLPGLTPEIGEKASLVTGSSDDDSEVTYTAKDIGEAGNDIKIAYVADDEADEVDVLVKGTFITVVCVTSDNEITTTSAEIVAKIAATPEASSLVVASGDGEGKIEAMEPTPLSGGKDTTPAKKGDVFFDADNIYIAISDIEITDEGTGWHKIKHAAFT